MKIICDCGNEEEFSTIDSDTGMETGIDAEEGQYATIRKFTFWERHDQVGIECDKCKKAIWMFT